MNTVNNKPLSAADRAKEIVEDFHAWVSAREAAADWSKYVNQHGKLNRTKVAAECGKHGFATSCYRSNENLRTAVLTLEVRLAASEKLKASKSAQKAIDQSTDDLLVKRLTAAKNAAEARAKELEEKLAALKAQLHDHNETLKTFRHLDDHLSGTGRLLRP
jgi:LPS O-antigen subunit length determinant protein (WzzB/FepE family)